VAPRPVRDEPLQVADGNRLAPVAADAQGLALHLLRADPSRYSRQGVVAQQDVRGAAEITLCHLHYERGNVDPYRTAVDALRLFAAEASLRLAHRDLLRQAEVHLAKRRGPFRRVARGHALSFDLQPFRRFHRAFLRHRSRLHSS